MTDLNTYSPLRHLDAEGVPGGRIFTRDIIQTADGFPAFMLWVFGTAYTALTIDLEGNPYVFTGTLDPKASYWDVTEALGYVVSSYEEAKAQAIEWLKADDLEGVQNIMTALMARREDVEAATTLLTFGRRYIARADAALDDFPQANQTLQTIDDED